jgi:tripartite-type tricarboxylate transporter receptor subunit TctC
VNSHIVVTSCVALLAVTGPTYGQPYPSKPVTVVVPAPAGGPTDIIGRLVAQILTSQVGQNVVVDNRSGAGNTLGTEYVAKAKPDGYTLTVGSPSSHSIAPSIYKNLPYDPVKDFTPVILLATAPTVLVIHPSIPARNLKEFVALAKARPGELNFGSGGNGTTSHLTGEYFKLAAGVKITHIPYKGSAGATTDLLGGQIQMMFHGLHLSLPYMRTGKLRGLGVTSSKRSPLMPDLVTLSEAGLRGFEVNTWYGLLGPAGVPKEIVAKLNGAILKAIETPSVRQRMVDQGLDIIGSTPEQFGKAIAEEKDKWAKVVQQSGARVD